MLMPPPMNEHGISVTACDSCHAVRPVRATKFMMNIGLIVLRLERQVGGQLCKSCVWKTFWGYTLGNLVLGWWGLKSFFYTLIFLFANIGELMAARPLLRLPADPAASPSAPPPA